MTAAVQDFGPDCLLDGIRNGTGESPVWDAASGCWFWIDIPNRGVYRLHAATSAIRHWRLAEVVGSMVLRPDGGMVCACTTGIFDVDLPEEPGAEEASMTRLASVEHPSDGMRFNDGRCDRQGRLVVSTMVSDISLARPAGRWYRFTRAEGLRETGLDSILVPNGSAFSPDGRTFYASDTHPKGRLVWAHDYDPDTGIPSNRRVFIDMRGMVGRPDGAAVDVGGCYWICCLDEGCIKRFTPAGVLDRVIRLPMRKPAMCAFGGPDGRLMMVTSLSRGPTDLAADPHGGRVAIISPGAQGLPEPRLSL